MITYNNSGSAGSSFSRMNVWSAYSVDERPGIAFDIAANPHDGSVVLDYAQVRHLRDILASWLRDHPVSPSITGESLDGR